jgi:hypothetical protein
MLRVPIPAAGNAAEAAFEIWHIEAPGEQLLVFAQFQLC